MSSAYLCLHQYVFLLKDHSRVPLSDNLSNNEALLINDLTLHDGCLLRY